jgi:hypothetical protein
VRVQTRRAKRVFASLQSHRQREQFFANWTGEFFDVFGKRRRDDFFLMSIVITHGNSNGNSTGALNDDDASPPPLRLYVYLSISKRRVRFLKI